MIFSNHQAPAGFYKMGQINSNPVSHIRNAKVIKKCRFIV